MLLPAQCCCAGKSWRGDFPASNVLHHLGLKVFKCVSILTIIHHHKANQNKFSENSQNNQTPWKLRDFANPSDECWAKLSWKLFNYIHSTQTRKLPLKLPNVYVCNSVSLCRQGDKPPKYLRNARIVPYRVVLVLRPRDHSDPLVVYHHCYLCHANYFRTYWIHFFTTSLSVSFDVVTFSYC